MTEEDIIPSRTDVLRMAREAGFEQNSLGMTYTSGSLPKLLERFAALVAAAAVEREREACAKVLDEMAEDMEREMEPSTAVAWVQSKAASIRARGRHENATL